MPSPIVKPLITALLLAGPASAHGAFVDVGTTEAVTIHGRYDTGEPMAGAQVSVFAPDDPAQPWLTGLTDAEGMFVFVPDARQGRWAVQVRQAGHGAMGYIVVGADAMTATAVMPASPSGLTWAQRLLMVACVLWGCVGTALYFRPTRKAAT